MIWLFSKQTYTFCHLTYFIHNYNQHFCLLIYLTQLNFPLPKSCLVFFVNHFFIVNLAFIVQDWFILWSNWQSQQIIILISFFWTPTFLVVFRSFQHFVRIFIEGYDYTLENCLCAVRNFSYHKYSFKWIQIMYWVHGRCLLVSQLNPNLVKVLPFENHSMCRSYSVLFISHSLEHKYLWNWFIMELSILEIK